MKAAREERRNCREAPQTMPSMQAAVTRSRILIVEDDVLMGAFYKSLFRRLEPEFTWHLAKNGEDALAYLNGQDVDVVILDWDLPGIKGLDVLKAIRAHPTKRVARVFVITGRNKAEDKSIALRLGADDYLSKPFEIEDLLTRLRILLHS